MNGKLKMSNEEISSIFEEMIVLFKLRKKIDLIVKELEHFGEHTQSTHKILKRNRLSGKIRMNKTISYSIKLSDKIVEISRYEEILSQVVFQNIY